MLLWIALLYAPSVLCALLAKRDSNLSPIWLLSFVIAPLAGPLAYLAAFVLPRMLGVQGPFDPPPLTPAQMQPLHDYREAVAALKAVPTLANQIRYANIAASFGHNAESENAWVAAISGQGANDPVVLLGYAELLARLRRWTEALPLLERWNALGERDAAATLLFARTFEGLSRNEEAERAYLQVIQGPRAFEAKSRYVAFLAATGRRDEAQRLYEDLHNALMEAPPAMRDRISGWVNLAERAVWTQQQ